MRLRPLWSRRRRGIAVLAVTILGAVGLYALPAAAAPTRYEAESANIMQGTVASVHPGFSGTGFVDYANAVGSAVEWTVNAEAAGSATLTIRYANGTAVNRPMSVAVNGAMVDAALAFNGTGAWTSWASATLTASLNAGANTVRATATTATGGPNVDYLDVDMAAAPADDLQAENATIVQGVAESVHAGFTGTGYVNYDNAVGGYVQWTVNGATAGPATLRIRYANGSTGNRPMDISVNGAVVAPAAAFAATGAWTTWATAVVPANLSGGTNTVRATATTAGGGPNVDALAIGPGGEGEPPTVPGNPRVTGTTASSISLAWNASTDNVGVTGYTVREGNSVVASPTGTTATVSGLAPSTSHTYTIAARDAAGNESGRSAPVAGTTQPGNPGGRTPVEINGQLRVCGTKLCNQFGNPIQLRGMSTHGLQWYGPSPSPIRNCITSASLDALANDWNADHLRLSMYIQEGGYTTNPRAFTDMMHSLINQVSARGLYAVVDWHQLTPGNPNANLDRARTFFAEIAERHANKPNILYDIANEPNGTPWAQVKAYHEAVIPVIRQRDPDAVILLGTHGWSTLGHSDGRPPTDVYNNPVNATNVMYTFHFYAASHGSQYLNLLSSAADRIPMFVTEFGTQQASGDGGNNFGQSQQYIDMMRAKKISWTNWNYSDDGRTGAVWNSGTCSNGPWTPNRLKAAGTWVRERIMSPADDFPTN